MRVRSLLRSSPAGCRAALGDCSDFYLSVLRLISPFLSSYYLIFICQRAMGVRSAGLGLDMSFRAWEGTSRYGIWMAKITTKVWGTGIYLKGPRTERPRLAILGKENVGGKGGFYSTRVEMAWF